MQLPHSYSGNNVAEIFVVVILYSLFQKPVYYISLGWHVTSFRRYNYIYGSDTKDYAKLTAGVEDKKNGIDTLTSRIRKANNHIFYF